MVRLKRLFEEALRENKAPYHPINRRERLKRIEDKGGLDYLKAQASQRKSLREIANELGIRSDDIRFYLKGKGVRYSELKKTEYKQPKTGKQRIDESGGIDQLRVYARQGLNQKQVAVKYGLKNGSTISDYIRERGYYWEELQNVCE